MVCTTLNRSLAWLFCTCSLLAAPQLYAQTEVRSTPTGFQLYRNGAPYSVRGVGGTDQLELLAELGGNSIRTWSTDNLGEILDAAERHGLTVCAGIWLGHERHGFDYQDETAVLRQLDTALASVRKYKNHPALLMWGIGNEMEGAGTNPSIWYAVDHIAREIKEVDPNHPTMTVIAELGDHKLASIERVCPHIDIVGINSYGGISTLAERVAGSRLSKPYLVTEHGPLGPWETEKTPWGAAIESSSTIKAKRYAAGYQATAIADSQHCLGTYAFLWGHKQETTATWFGMLLPDGARLQAADELSRLWTGQALSNRCPQITRLTAVPEGRLKPGTQVKAEVSASAPENDTLKYEWQLCQDSLQIGIGGDRQAGEQPFADAVVSEGASATVTMPEGGGGYRLFVTVRDGKGTAAVANIPFYVDAPVKMIPARRASLPFVLYGGTSDQQSYWPSGYMGNASAVVMTADCSTNPQEGQTCMKVEYRSSSDWGGVLWQSPANDWEGQQPGGLDLSAAKELTFWARGQDGGELVNFVIGGLDGPGPYRDTTRVELADVSLTTQWKQYHIPLTGRDLSRIKTAFGWSAAAQGRPLTFYLDGIEYR